MTWGVPAVPTTSSGVWITIDDVKDHLNITDTADDDLLADLLEMAQDALDKTYGLPTVPQANETRRYTVRDSKLVLLDECASVSSITDQSGSVLASTDYTVLYGRRTADFLRGVVLEATYDGQLAIAGTWGYAVCPADVGRALLTTVSTWYKRTKLGDTNDTIGNLSTLPREAKDLMEARRPASI